MAKTEVEQARELKRKTERDILILLCELEAKTGMGVSDLSISQEHVCGGGMVICDVNIKMEL